MNKIISLHEQLEYRSGNTDVKYQYHTIIIRDWGKELGVIQTFYVPAHAKLSRASNCNRADQLK